MNFLSHTGWGCGSHFWTTGGQIWLTDQRWALQILGLHCQPADPSSRHVWLRKYLRFSKEYCPCRGRSLRQHANAAMLLRRDFYSCLTRSWSLSRLVRPGTDPSSPQPSSHQFTPSLTLWSSGTLHHLIKRCCLGWWCEWSCPLPVHLPYPTRRR